MRTTERGASVDEARSCIVGAELDVASKLDPGAPQPARPARTDAPRIAENRFIENLLSFEPGLNLGFDWL